jgi:hypothetical protein
MKDAQSLTTKWLARAAMSCLGGLAVWGVVQYPGSKPVFCFFTLIICTIGYVSVRSVQYAHFFLGIAWFLGFWIKYLFHQATGAVYHEFHGAFDYSAASWDAVFLVISVGGVGYLFGRLIFLPFTDIVKALRRRSIVVPSWWARYRNLIWFTAVLLVFAVVVANQELGLLTRGYVARIVLPWPFGGLFAWTTDIGLALLVCILLAWDRQSNWGAVRGFILLCVEGALVSVSTLSRGIYFFHTVPALLTEGSGVYRSGKPSRLAVLLMVWILVGVAVPSVTTFLRLFGQDAVPVTKSELVMSEKVEVDRPMLHRHTVRVLWDQFVTMAQILVVDRWTGLEGVMATVAYPDRNAALLLEAVSLRRSYGTVDVYTKKISGSSFSEENAKKYHFATLAGPVALFYFSGSLLVVFGGMALISVLMSVIELLWLSLVRDRLVVATSGLYLALIVLQLSGSLIQSATSVITVTCAFVCIWLMGNSKGAFDRLRKLRSSRGFP